MNETRVHVVITDVWRSDPPCESSVVKFPSGAGKARLRAVASSECCSFVKQTPAVSGKRGTKRLPSPYRMGEGRAVRGTRCHTNENRRSRGDGTQSSSERVNWGPSGRRRAVGINHKPTVATRSSDVAIVSEEAGGQNNRRRSQGPLGGCVVSEAMSAAGRQSHYGIETRMDEISTVAASKLAERRRRARLTARLKPYWGKPAVRNYRGGGGNGCMVWRPFATKLERADTSEAVGLITPRLHPTRPKVFNCSF